MMINCLIKVKINFPLGNFLGQLKKKDIKITETKKTAFALFNTISVKGL